MDSISEARLLQVHPLLADKIRLMAASLSAEGIDVRVTQGLRTWEEQQALYDQGRTTPGKIVTNAEPGYSYHNFGLAVDLVPMTELGPDWNINHPAWQKMIQAGVQVGLTAGAMWRTFPDQPHFQLTGNLPVTPTPQVRQTYTTGGMAAVWDMTGLSEPTDTTGDVSV